LLITLMALLKLERSSLMTIRQSTKKEVWFFWFVRVVLFNFEVLQALPTKSLESLSTLF
jgi:hypothetical protein